MLTTPTDRTATRLPFFVQNWKQITQGTWTLQTIQGYNIPLLHAPKAMVHESNQSKMQLGCSPYGDGYQGQVY